MNAAMNATVDESKVFMVIARILSAREGRQVQLLEVRKLNEKKAG